LKVIKSLRNNVQIIRLKKDEVFAEMTYQTGEKEYREFYYGSGYLSQSSRVCKVPAGVITVTFTSYKGETRTIKLNNK
jgi:outer membrane protein assembly factor BamA